MFRDPVSISEGTGNSIYILRVAHVDLESVELRRAVIGTVQQGIDVFHRYLDLFL